MTQRYTVARGYGNTQRFVNYGRYDELVSEPLVRRHYVVDGMLGRLEDPMEVGRCSPHEYLIYQVRAKFLIRVLIPPSARTQEQKEFLDAPYSGAQAWDMVGSQDLVDILNMYTCAEVHSSLYPQDVEWYAPVFDKADKMFGDYRHAVWLKKQKL